MSNSPQELDMLKSTFFVFDSNADGYLEPHDIFPAVRSLGINPTDQQIGDAFGEIGQINFKDFTRCAGPLLAGQNPKMTLTQAFKTFDRDGNGTIQAGELRHVLNTMAERLSGTDIETLIADADPAGSGLIKYESYVEKLLQ